MTNDPQTRRQFLKNAQLFAASAALMGGDSSMVPDIDLNPFDSDLKIVDEDGNEVADDVEKLILTGALEAAKKDDGVELTAEGLDGLWSENEAGAITAEGKTVRDIDYGIIDHVGSEDEPAESVHTEVLNNTDRYIGPDETVADINDAIEEVWQAGGGEVHLAPGATYEIDDQTGTVLLKSNVALDAHWSTITYADGVGDDLPPDGMVRFDPYESGGCVDAHVRNIEVTGNLDNNSFTDRRYRQGIQMYPYELDESGFPAEEGIRPQRCSVKYAYVHDTVASCIQPGGQDSTWENLWLGGSADDHAVYCNTGINNEIEKVWISGFYAGSIITFNASGDWGAGCWGNTVDQVWIRELEWTSPHDQISSRESLSYTILGRNPGDHRSENNTVKNVDIDVSNADPSSGDETRMRIRQPGFGIENLNWRGATPNADGILKYDGDAEDCWADDLTIEVTAMESGATIPAVGFHAGAGSRVSDVTVRDETDEQKVRAFTFRPSDAALDHISVGHVNGTVGGSIFRVDEAGGDHSVSELSIDGPLTIDRGGSVFSISGNPTFGAGTKAPQDMRQSNYWESGRVGFHDGSGDGNEGPAEFVDTDILYYSGASESADAEQPQGSYAPGQIVEFTDSGDGSGDGLYWITEDGTPIQIADTS